LTRVSEFAKLLRQYRLEAGWTQEQLAQRCAVSVRTISDLERGRIGRPRGYTAEQLAGALPLSREQRDQLLTAARRPESKVVQILPGAVPVADDSLGSRQLPRAVAELVGRAEELKYLTSLVYPGLSRKDNGAAVVFVVLMPA